MSETKKLLTWTKLKKAVPQLEELRRCAQKQERELVAYREDGEIHLTGYHARDHYRVWIKPCVDRLVGWYRQCGPDFLRTCEAWSIAIHEIYGALPDDFTEEEIEEAWERAYEADLEEGDSLTLYGPGAEDDESEEAA